MTPKKIKAIKDKIRQLTPRNHGMNVKEMVKRLNPVLRGWANYFRIANCKGLFSALPNSWFDEIGLINLTTDTVGILHHFREK